MGMGAGGMGRMGNPASTNLYDESPLGTQMRTQENYYNP